jgi:hypothetical protein
MEHHSPSCHSPQQLHATFIDKIDAVEVDATCTVVALARISGTQPATFQLSDPIPLEFAFEPKVCGAIVFFYRDSQHVNTPPLRPVQLTCSTYP